MIVADDLTKRRGERTVVSGVTFRCEPGTVTGFLGPNGAGTPMVCAETASASRPRRPGCWAEASSRTPTRRPGFGRSR